MTISFSGLASGLDTSSWVESLVALRRAKVESLQQQKEEVVLSKDTLSSIRTFFASFRAAIEKITDSKFNIVSMDLFAQNLAISSNIDVLTATATTEAEEATYKVKVDKLASNTKAISNYNYKTTIVETTTATADSYLKHLGVTAGNIAVTVEGVTHGINISEQDTIATFIEKLKNIGVEASYNENTGVFSMNIDSSDINDFDNTNIVNALHLTDVNEGYKTTNKLEIATVETEWNQATEGTLLSELGVNSGDIEINANGTTYNYTVDNNISIGTFVDDLKGLGLEASFQNGIFILADAEITSVGDTDIINKMGLQTDIFSKSQKTDALTQEITVTESTTATSDTLLKDIGEGTAISDGQTVIIKNSNNEYTTITVGTATSIGDVLESMSNAGLYAAIDEYGIVEISGGTITGGTFDAVKALGLHSEPYTAMTTGDPLTETLIEYEIVTYDTRLVDDLGVSEGYLKVIDADGNTYYEKIYSGQTIGDFMADLGNLGINTSLDMETGVLTITGGAFETLTDVDVQALVDNLTIAETDARYIKGTDILTCLYGAPVIATDQIQVASAYSRTKALTQSVTNIVEATTDTTLGTLGLTDGTAIFNARGETVTINVTSDMTIQGLIDELAANGIESSWDSDFARITINNTTLTGGDSNLADVLALSTTISGKYVTSDAIHSETTISVDATRDTTFAELGVNSNETVVLRKEDGTSYTFNITGTTTMGTFLDTLNANGVTARIENGIFAIDGGYIVNSAIETALGLESVAIGYSNVLGTQLSHTIITTATGDTTLGDIIKVLNTESAVAGGYTAVFNSIALNVNENTTLDEFMMQIYAQGGTSSLDAAGRMHIDGGTLSGTVATALGFISVTTTDSVAATGETLSTIVTVNADTTTRLGDIGLEDSTITIKETDGAVIGTITTTTDMTIGDLFDALAGFGINGAIHNGYITLTSETGRYAEGGIIADLGIGTADTTYTTTTGATNTSTETITHTIEIIADSGTTLGQLGYTVDTTVTVHGIDGVSIGAITTHADMTINDLLTALAGYGISGTIEDGQITLSSQDGVYATGGVISSMDIDRVTLTTTITTTGIENTSSSTVTYNTTKGTTQTSSIAITVSTYALADSDTTLGALGYGNTTVSVLGPNATPVGTIVTNADMTIGDLLTALAGYGISGTIRDGQIHLDSDIGNYATGGVITSMGIGTSSTTTETTVTTTAGRDNTSSATVTYSTTTYETTFPTITQTIITTCTTTLTQATIGTQTITVSQTITTTEPVIGSETITVTVTDTLTLTEWTEGTQEIVVTHVIEDTTPTYDNRTITISDTYTLTVTGSESTTNITTYVTTQVVTTQAVTATFTTQITVTEPIITTQQVSVTHTVTHHCTATEPWEIVVNLPNGHTIDSTLEELGANPGDVLTLNEYDSNGNLLRDRTVSITEDMLNYDFKNALTAIAQTQFGYGYGRTGYNEDRTQYYINTKDQESGNYYTCSGDLAERLGLTPNYTVFTTNGSGTSVFTVTDTATSTTVTTLYTEVTVPVVTYRTITTTMTSTTVVTDSVSVEMRADRGTSLKDILEHDGIIFDDIRRDIELYYYREDGSPELLNDTYGSFEGETIEELLQWINDSTSQHAGYDFVATFNDLTGVITIDSDVDGAGRYVLDGNLAEALGFQDITYTEYSAGDTVTLTIRQAQTHTIVTTNTGTVLTSTADITYSKVVGSAASSTAAVTYTKTFGITSTSSIAIIKNTTPMGTVKSTSTVKSGRWAGGIFYSDNATATNATSLYNLGLTTNAQRTLSIKVDTSTYIVTFTTSDTVQTVVDFINSKDINNEDVISASFENGTLTVSSTLHNTSILSSGIATAFKIQNMLPSTQRVILTEAMTFNHLGSMGGIFREVTVVNNTTGAYIVFTAQATNTMGDLITFLSSNGITSYITNGKFTIEGNNNCYVRMSEELANALALSDYTSTTSINATLNTNINKLTGNSNLRITVMQNTTNYTISIHNSQTIEELFIMLASHDITASIRNGTISLTGTEDSYISGIAAALATALKINTSDCYTTVTRNATSDTKISDTGISITSSNSIVISDANGTLTTITTQASDTFEDLINRLDPYAITTMQNGRFSIQARPGYNIDISDGFKTAFKLDANASDGVSTSTTITTVTTTATTTVANTMIVFDSNTQQSDILNYSDIQTNNRTLTIAHSLTMTNIIGTTESTQTVATEVTQQFVTTSPRTITVDGSGTNSITIIDPTTYEYTEIVSSNISIPRITTTTRTVDIEAIGTIYSVNVTGTTIACTTSVSHPAQTGTYTISVSNTIVVQTITGSTTNYQTTYQTFTIQDLQAVERTYTVSDTATFTVENTTTREVNHTILQTFTVEKTTTAPITVTFYGTATIQTTSWLITPTTGTATLTGDTTFSQLGITENQTATVVSDGEVYGVTVETTDSVNDFLTALAGLGIYGNVTGGILTLQGDSNAYFTDISLGLRTALKLSDDYYGTTSSTTTITAWSNTDSSVLSTGSTSTNLTADMTFQKLETLGVDATDRIISVVHNGQTYTFSMQADDTIADMFNYLAGVGISGSITDGKVTLTGNEHSYISSMQSDLKTALKMSSAVFTEAQSNTLSTNTMLYQLGINSDKTISVVSDGTAYAVLVEKEDTIDDVISALAGLGIHGYVTDGKLTLRGDQEAYITYIDDDLRTALKLSTSNYTTSTATIYATDVSNQQKYDTVNTLTTDDTFADLQMTATGYITIVSDGTQYVVTVHTDDTVDDIISTLAGYGIVGSVTGGKITFSGDDEAFILGMTSEVSTALKLGNTTYSTATHTATTNTRSDQQKETVREAATGTTRLQDLKNPSGDSPTGYQLILSTTSDAGNELVTINFTATDTVYDVIDTLQQHGLIASVDCNGQLSVHSSSLTDFDISGSLGTFMMGSYTKRYDEGRVYSISTNLAQETIVNMDDSTLLSKLNITNGNIILYQNGNEISIDIDNTKTVGDFRNQLFELGVHSEIIEGRLSLTADGVVYLKTPTSGASNLVTIMGLEHANWTLGDYSQESDHLTDTDTIIHSATMDDKISELTNADGSELGVTAGQIYVYQDGTRNTLNIDTNDTLQDLANKLSQYGISMGISANGKIYFDGNNNSYLTTDGIASGSASNILNKFNILNNWTNRYNSTSQTLDYEVQEDTVVNGSTKLVDLQDSSGNDLGITTGNFYVYQNGVRKTESITEDTTVNDFVATLANYGITTEFDENGSLHVGGYNETYLATSATSGDDTNAIAVLFEQWDFVNIYTSNGLDIPQDVTVAISTTTKLADINNHTYQAGYISVIKDGVKTNIELTADDTVGDLINELELYGFESVINAEGQLIIKNTGDSLLQAYSGAGTASNALEILGIDLSNWISTNSYESNSINVTQTTTNDISATRETLLSDLGVSTGEYYIWNNGVKYTAFISSDETIGSLIQTLESFGIATSLVDTGAGSQLSIQSSGNCYVAESNSTNNQSNIMDVLFNNSVSENYAYTGYQQTSTLVTTYTAATEDTLLSYFDNGILQAEGDLSVTVDGVNCIIKVENDETIGSFLNKFRLLGLEATISNGNILIQSGYKDFVINTTGTTSNAPATLNLVYDADLGGYMASNLNVEQTTTSIEEATLSVSKYANSSTQMKLLNISDGSLTVYRDGEKATIQIDSNQTFGDLQALVAARFADVKVEIDNDTGYLKFYSTTPNVGIEVGSTTDTSNFSAITGVASDGNGSSISARELYCVNNNSTITTTGLFRRGDVVAGTFTVGDAEFTINDTTKLSDIISQINASETANATAYWDSIEGKLVIKSRTTGAALVNIEAGTSNFTDIMGFTNSEWDDADSDGNQDIGISQASITKMNVNAQEIGDNAKFSINGTYYTSSSNTIGSDVSRITGVTINLKGVSEGETTLTIERDKETVANAMSDIVDAYNALIENVDKEIAKGAPLADQTSLKLIRNQIRSLMTNSLAGSLTFKNFDAIGISLDAASAGDITTNHINILKFDKDKFLKAFDADRNALKNLLVGTETNKGILLQVENVVENAIAGASGFFSSADKAYNTKISKLDNKIKKATEALERYRERLEAKFQSMDLLISQIQNQYSSFLGT